jgi:hypothetical protein
MDILSDLAMYTRFAWGLRGFLRQTITLDEAEAIVRRRMAEREASFLRLVERGIFGYARSPYLPLLKLADCELGDIQNMVKDKGLEDTLKALREAGVYVTFEEFKGREPVVRHGKLIPVQARDFDNPYLKHCYETRSGGTTGAGTRVPTDLDHLAAQAAPVMIAYAAHDLLDVPKAMWFGLLPDGTGVNTALRKAFFGKLIEKWFTPVISRDFRPSPKSRLATWFIVTMGRLHGTPIPRPEPVRLEQATVVAHWAAKALEDHSACLIRTHVSKAVRVCIAAREEGLDLTGVTFMGGGVPTQAKVREITRTGARHVPNYFFSEAGAVGWGCAQPADVNDIHFFKDCLAFIQHPRYVPGPGITVDAFHFTTLLPTAPKLMFNVEIDDYGVFEKRSCGCLLEALGYTEHLRDIRSFSKLHGEEATITGSEMIHILEEVLPARFGGTPLDYQLLEEEDNKGLTRLSLLVSPRIEITDENEVIEVVLEALGRGSVAADLARAHWSQAGTFQVKRENPIWTSRGKLMPLHLAHRSERSTNPSAH